MAIMSEPNRKKAEQFICVVCNDKVTVNNVAFTNGCNHSYHEQCLIEMTHPKSNGHSYEQYSKAEKKEKWICPACKSPFNRMIDFSGDLQSDDFCCPECALQVNFADEVTIKNCHHEMCTYCITPYLNKTKREKKRRFSICPDCKQKAERFAKRFQSLFPNVQAEEARIRDLYHEPTAKKHESQRRSRSPEAKGNQVASRGASQFVHYQRERPKTIKTRPILDFLEEPGCLKNITSFKGRASRPLSSCSDDCKKLAATRGRR